MDTSGQTRILLENPFGWIGLPLPMGSVSLPIYNDGIQCDAPRTFLMNFDERGPSGNGGSECSDDGRPETILAEEFRFSTCFGFSG